MMDSGPEVVGPINIGNPGEFTMVELAETVLRLTQSKSKLEFRPLPSDDPKQRRPDIGLAQQHLGWQPRVSLADGLVPTIAYFRQLLGKGAPARAPSRVPRVASVSAID
jgi:UDP-glucuronate decarboxylase